MVTELTQGFDDDVLVRFLRSKFPSFSESREEVFPPEDTPYESAERLGVVKTLPGPGGANKPLLIVTARMPEGVTLSERSSRVRQFAFAKKTIDGVLAHPTPGIDGILTQGLFIFHDDDGNFRLSLVFGKAEGARLVWSSAKRLSFYVDAGAPNKTFRDRAALDWSTFDKLKDAFSVEKLTKEFYSRLFAWYQTAMDAADIVFPNDIVKDKEAGEVKSEQIIRLITRLMFAWFLKQKGLIPNTLFDPADLTSILTQFHPLSGDNYYRTILQNLFFATLNSEIRERGFAVDAGSKKENREHFGVKMLYRYGAEFALSEDKVLELFSTIPFLNGGLFECLDRDGDYFDGFSREKSKQARVPNWLFFDEAGGLIPLLRQYNFTVEENSPGDEEVALDPELLGKVFENLLGAYNPETQVAARNATGSFYTPREIVNYMVDESLKAHVLGRLGASRENAAGSRKADEDAIEMLFVERVRPDDESLCKAIEEALATARIFDPACGSGAFPMGVLLRMTELLRVLRGVAADDHKGVYDLKLQLIENCIYGSDIQCIAVQISKLRFFISLVCEQQPTNDPQANYNIHTLPNLETKFVAANSLIGLPRSGEMLPMQSVEALKKELWGVRHKHFLARSYQEKKALRKEDKRLREALAKALEEGGGFDTDSARLMAAWDPYDQNKSAPFSDPEWMFNVKNGFDVVIGNPPYGRILSENDEVLLSKRWPAFRATKDAFVAFMLHGFVSVRQYGVACFIIPSAWLGGPKYELLRAEVLNKTISQIISLPFDMFAAAYVDNAITLFMNMSRPEGWMVQVYAYPKKAKVNDFTPGPWEVIDQREWGSIAGQKFILSSAGLSLQRKLHEKCRRSLNDVLEMKRGVLFDIRILTECRAGPHSLQYFEGDVYRYELHCKFGGWATFAERMKECPKSDRWFRGERLLLRRLVNRRQRLMATLAQQDFLTNKNIYSLLRRPCGHALECLLALINSRLMSRLYIEAVSQAVKDDFPQVTITDFLSLPIPTVIVPDDESKLASLTNRILSAKKSDPATDTSALEAEIDRLVYQLYGLTDEEIAIVEGSQGEAPIPAGQESRSTVSEPPSEKKTRRRKKAALPKALEGWD